MISGSVLVVAGVAYFLLVSRDTQASIVEQKELELRSELQALNEFRDWNRTQKENPDTSVARLFLSKEILDSLLEAFSGMDVAIPNAEGVKLVIKELHSDFRPGFPGVAMRATVENSGVVADVAALARIEPQLENGNLKLRVHLDSLVPRVSWRFINLTLGGLVRDMAQARFTDAINDAEALGSITIPVSQSAAFEVPPTQVPFSVPGFNGTISIPSYAAKGTVTLSRIMAMPEGLYIYTTVKKEG